MQEAKSLPLAPEDEYDVSKPYGYLCPRIPLRCLIASIALFNHNTISSLFC